MLSAGENLLICRRRAGLRQDSMGERYGLNRHGYGRRERDAIATDLPVANIEFDHLYTQEKCVIYRKRANLTQREVAALLGLSRYWINQKEIGRVDCADLLKFWEERQCQK